MKGWRSNAPPPKIYPHYDLHATLLSSSPATGMIVCTEMSGITQQIRRRNFMFRDKISVGVFIGVYQTSITKFIVLFQFINMFKFTPTLSATLKLLENNDFLEMAVGRKTAGCRHSWCLFSANPFTETNFIRFWRRDSRPRLRDWGRTVRVQPTGGLPLPRNVLPARCQHPLLRAFSGCSNPNRKTQIHGIWFTTIQLLGPQGSELGQQP